MYEAFDCSIVLLKLIGNIWGQSWTNIIDVTIPYPGKNYLDVTQEMQAQVRARYYIILVRGIMPRQANEFSSVRLLFSSRIESNLLRFESNGEVREDSRNWKSCPPVSIKILFLHTPYCS